MLPFKKLSEIECGFKRFIQRNSTKGKRGHLNILIQVSRIRPKGENISLFIYHLNKRICTETSYPTLHPLEFCNIQNGIEKPLTRNQTVMLAFSLP